MSAMRNTALLCLSAILLLSGCAGQARPSANLGELRTSLLAYEESGAYGRDVAGVADEAVRWIAARAPQVRRPAIVLDIDETSLSNWPELKANGLTFKMPGACGRLPDGPCGLDAWQHMARAEAIGPTLRVFRAAQARHVAVFFITGRDGKLRAATAANLRRAGYGSWTGLTLRPAGSTTPSASDYKIPARARIEAAGYHIIANIGDQPSDLAGGHADRAFLLPNPFYRIP